MNSHRITSNRSLLPEIAEMIGPFKSDIMTIYYDIFTATKKKTRAAFFQEPLV